MGIRILALVTEAFGGHGGIALYNRDMLTALCAQPGVDAVVAIPRLMSEQPGDYPDKLSYITTGIEGKSRYIGAVLSTVMRREKFDLILCGHINLLPVSELARVMTNSQLLLATYGIDVWKPTRSFLANWLARRLEHFFSISEVTKNRFLDWSQLPADRGVLLPNAIHLEWYGTGEPPPYLHDRHALHGKKIIMTLGRISASERYKGFDEVLEVLPDLIEAVPDIHYLVAGDGDDLNRLRKKAEQLDVAAHVTFTGRIDEDEKADFFRLADAYVMPSSGEGFGFVFLEAMACGIPVVASATDGGKEALRGGEMGILVDPRDRQQLCSAVLDALKQPKAIPETLDYFSFDSFKNRVGSLLDSIETTHSS